MKERPILFSGPMIRAIVDKRKTQTRRRVAPRDLVDGHKLRLHGARACVDLDDLDDLSRDAIRWCSPYGEPGDRLWVRETFYCDDYRYPDAPTDEMRDALEYRADHDCRSWEAGCPCRDENGRSAWKPSIHMPRWASRITLDVTSIRVERLQSITDADARAEGISVSVLDPSPRGTEVRAKNYVHEREAFADLWDEINGERLGVEWAANPWVWVVGFEVRG